ncbi:MAG: hypothetical protein ACREP9_00960 [Candidatus Dormibacteraceae bacterium]
MTSRRRCGNVWSLGLVQSNEGPTEGLSFREPAKPDTLQEDNNFKGMCDDLIGDASPFRAALIDADG